VRRGFFKHRLPTLDTSVVVSAVLTINNLPFPASVGSRGAIFHLAFKRGCYCPSTDSILGPHSHFARSTLTGSAIS
jgi:hypothetical protein